MVKIPAVPEGFKAMKELNKEGILITATAIYTPLQGFLAGKCGASYAAPYINRIDNMGITVSVAKQMHDIFKKNNLKTEVLAASFKNFISRYSNYAEYGVGASTVAPEVIEGLVKNQAITAAIEDFVKDFETLAGEGKTMSSC